VIQSLVSRWCSADSPQRRRAGNQARHPSLVGPTRRGSSLVLALRLEVLLLLVLLLAMSLAMLRVRADSRSVLVFCRQLPALLRARARDLEEQDLERVLDRSQPPRPRWALRRLAEPRPRPGQRARLGPTCRARSPPWSRRRVALFSCWRRRAMLPVWARLARPLPSPRAPRTPPELFSRLLRRRSTKIPREPRPRAREPARRWRAMFQRRARYSRCWVWSWSGWASRSEPAAKRHPGLTRLVRLHRPSASVAETLSDHRYSLRSVHAPDKGLHLETRGARAGISPRLCVIRALAIAILPESLSLNGSSPRVSRS